jgi:hypothetical protein
MKKKMYVLGVAALMAALLAMSGVAQSAMWVGAELGGNFPLNPDLKVSLSTPAISENLSGLGFRPSVIGGVTIGYDFVNSGFGAYAWPGWMQYFSFAMDLTYNRLEIRCDPSFVVPTAQPVFVVADNNIGQVNVPGNFRLKGYEVAWTFLFMAHYGFLRDDVAPSGRINPYIGVGPAILWTGFESSWGNTRGNAMNVALVVEPGIRWMCFKNISIDTAMRYRYAAPSHDFHNFNQTVNLATTLNQFAFLVRANYHF